MKLAIIFAVLLTSSVAFGKGLKPAQINGPIAKEIIRVDDTLSAKDYKELLSSLKVIFVDLNRDGRQDIVAKATETFCSHNGNCPYYIFRNHGNQSYKLVLATTGYVVKLKKSMHRGHKDLLVIAVCGFDDFIKEYEFNGHGYKDKSE
jgi:hypothetical protein